MLNLTYPAALRLLEQHLVPKRSESAAFLIWYLENYLRLDTLDAIDSVCDQSGDKGIDGIYLNEEANTIEVYQSKLFQKENPIVGDKTLREFRGTLAQLESEDAIENLIESAGEAEVARLVSRLDLKRHIAEYEVVGYFVCNAELDANGQAFLNAATNIRFIGSTDLLETFISSVREIPDVPPASFDITGYQISEYIVDQEHSAIIASVKAKELVELDGISNQSIFAYNVRGPLGRTKVNRDITKTILDQDKHKLFPLFHNGITVVAQQVEKTDESIEVSNYFIVNGCQSINALYQNKKRLTDDLRVLTKFIKAAPSSSLAEMITKFSNNQNGVKARDFKSNNQVQIRLQNEMAQHYGDHYFLEIKRGEDSGGREIISNEVAGQYLMAFDLKTPWSTHRKYQIFEDKHSDLFGRPSVTAHKVLACHVMASEIDAAKLSISNQLFARYVLTEFLILYILRLILENDEGGEDVINNPELYVADESERECFALAIRQLLSEVVTDLDAEIDQLGEDFDYRGRLRDEEWCDRLAHEIAGTHKKLVDRGRLDSFLTLYGAQRV